MKHMEAMKFHDATVHVGDLVSFHPTGAMFDVDVAVAMGVDRYGNLIVYCPMLQHLGREGYFKPNQVNNFRVTSLAADAIPLHSGNQRFAQNEEVISKTEAKKYPGQCLVVAALNDVVFFVNKGKRKYIGHRAENLARTAAPATT